MNEEDNGKFRPERVKSPSVYQCHKLRKYQFIIAICDNSLEFNLTLFSLAADQGSRVRSKIKIVARS